MSLLQCASLSAANGTPAWSPDPDVELQPLCPERQAAPRSGQLSPIGGSPVGRHLTPLGGSPKGALAGGSSLASSWTSERRLEFRSRVRSSRGHQQRVEQEGAGCCGCALQ
jgi:hypothetical protein